MKTKNLLPENYAAQCVKNWSKKESEFNALTKIEKIAILESMVKIDPTEKITFSENVIFSVGSTLHIDSRIAIFSIFVSALNSTSFLLQFFTHCAA